VTPKGGVPFDAWFDAKSHLLSRIVERQSGVAVTTTFSAYQPLDGTQQPARMVVSTGNAKYDQTFALDSAQFSRDLDTTAFAAPKSASADFSIAAGKSQTTFPFRLINNHIYGDVRVNGRGPFSFIFDTGGVNLVTPNFAKSLGLVIEGQSEARGAGAATMQSGYTKVARLSLGDASIDNQVFFSLPLDALSPIEGVDQIGMVGYETFRRFVTRIDYGARTVSLTDPKSFDARDAGTAIPIAFNGNAVIVDGSYDGIVAKFQIDTGSRGALTLDAPFVEKNGLSARYRDAIECVAGWGVGGPSREHAIRGAALKIGAVAIEGTVTGLSEDKGGAFADPTLAGNIGSGVLKQFVVTFDYNNRLMYLKRVPGKISDLNTFDRAGMWFNRDAEGFKIVDVTARAPAEEAGLKNGDLIVAVDGKAATQLDLPDLRYRLRNDPPGTVIKLSLRRHGEERQTSITLRDLI
jgi:membrane-associated protease RseP (regulator of RpoE activity)